LCNLYYECDKELGILSSDAINANIYYFQNYIQIYIFIASSCNVNIIVIYLE